MEVVIRVKDVSFALWRSFVIVNVLLMRWLLIMLALQVLLVSIFWFSGCQ